MMKPLHAMIGGAQKAGTTSLVNYLAQHPRLCVHNGRELTYFVNDEEYARGFDAVAVERYAHADADQLLIAKSAGVLDLPEAVDRLKRHNPDVKLVFLLRHPVDRAYSAYWFARQMGWEDIDRFEDALEAGADRFSQGDWVRRRNTAYLERGLYAKHLREVYARFDPQQVRVFLVEDLKADAAGLCRQVFEFLGVDADFVPDVTRRSNTAAAPRWAGVSRLMARERGWKRLARAVLPRSVGKQVKHTLRAWNAAPFTPPPMDPQTRRRLIAYFAQPNAELADLLGRDLHHWDQ